MLITILRSLTSQPYGRRGRRKERKRRKKNGKDELMDKGSREGALHMIRVGGAGKEPIFGLLELEWDGGSGKGSRFGILGCLSLQDLVSIPILLFIALCKCPGFK